jgi:Ca2+-binding RTX toxin-like protein
MGVRNLGPLAAAAIALVVLFLPAPAAAESTITPSCTEGPVADGGTIFGTPCDDRIVAPPGVAAVQGGGGDDTIVAAPITAAAECPEGCHLGIGSQTFEGGPGNDVVYGERGNDRLLGGAGSDQLFGGIGDDLLKGGPGNDRLSGGFGGDSIDGEADDDYARGDPTQDTILDTGGGNDTLSYSTGITPGFFNSHPFDSAAAKNLPSESGERGVYLDLTANDGDNGVAPNGGGIDEVEGASYETLIGTPFSDYIVGGEKAETIYGGGGGDVIFGNGGNDTLRGGADGDHLDGGGGTNALDGGAGNDYCEQPTSGANCESAVNKGGVLLRDGSKVSVGSMAPEYAPYSALYLVGSGAKDIVTASYETSPPHVTFILGSGSPAQFDSASSASSGCEPPGPNQVVCPLSAPLDSLVIAGLGGEDSLQAVGFPSTVSVITAGGGGDDSLTGEDATEDVLVDGPDEGDDTLSALAGDDALLNNGGADHLFGGLGNDLFLSNSICNGDSLDGGAGSERDNASWAKFKSAVEARLDAGDAGRPGSDGDPECTSGTPDSLAGIEDLEGTSSDDVFYGDAANNQLLGWAGSDSYFSAEGTDVILANSGDDDSPVDCGEGTDTALVDRPPRADDVSEDCETIQEADVNSFSIETQLPPPPPPEEPDPPEEPGPPEEPSGPAGEPSAPANEPVAPLPPGQQTPLPVKPSAGKSCLAHYNAGDLNCAQRPRKLGIGALGLLDRIGWKYWGAGTAIGFGHLTVSGGCCQPGLSTRGKVRASRRQLCAGRRWYTRLTITYGSGYRKTYVRGEPSAMPCD